MKTKTRVMVGKPSGFVIEQPLRVVLDKLGVVHEEIVIKDGQTHLLLAFKKQFLDYETLSELKAIVKSKEIRIYTQQYSRFTSSNIEHTGAIWCIDNQI